LSELEDAEESGEGESDPYECLCDSDADCCDFHTSEANISDSARTYEGSEAEYYYDVRDRRENYKRQMQQIRKEEEEEELEAQLNFEREKEEEVEAAYTCFKAARRRVKMEGRTIPSDTITGQMFNLFSSDHVTRFCNQGIILYRANTLQFSNEPDLYVDSDESNQPSSQARDNRVLYAHLDLGQRSYRVFGPFRHPKRARRKDTKIRSTDGQYDMRTKLFGNGYMKLSVTSGLIFEDDHVPSSSAPTMYTFAGILRDREKKRREAAERVRRELGTLHRPPRSRGSR
jgi:hypothetical protein